jgi:hypothetical protein
MPRGGIFLFSAGLIGYSPNFNFLVCSKSKFSSMTFSSLVADDGTD